MRSINNEIFGKNGNCTAEMWKTLILISMKIAAMKLQYIIEGVITITFILMKQIFCESYLIKIDRLLISEEDNW